MGNITVNNKKSGNRFEAEFCEILAGDGFWAHLMASRFAGQPADVIAARNEKAYLIDCKVCENDVFPLIRIEDNQHMAMQLWRARGNGAGWFALKTSRGIYMISYRSLENYKEKKQLNIQDIVGLGEIYEDWRDIR